MNASMSDPMGYFLTWTCYGTWLPGDDRQSVDNSHNTYGTQRVPANPGRAAAARTQMRHRPVMLCDSARKFVSDAIMAHGRHGGWNLLAVNVRSNHVHVVVAYPFVKPETVMGQLKSWSSRRLHETGELGEERPIWTGHGTTSYLWKQEDVAIAVQYVIEGQDPERFGGPKSRAD